MNNNITTLARKLRDNETKLAVVNQEIAQAIAGLQTKAHKLAEQNKNMRKGIKEAMRANNLAKYDDQFIAITYVAPSWRVGVDVAALQADKPKLFEKYKKVTKVSDSIRLRVKEPQYV